MLLHRIFGGHEAFKHEALHGREQQLKGFVVWQNLSGLIGRMQRDGHVAIAPGGQDRRSRVVTMTESGKHVWQEQARPKILAYYEQILADFSINDVTHTLHYLLKILENMQRLDVEWRSEEEGVEEAEAQ